jgi:hypothetical protein
MRAWLVLAVPASLVSFAGCGFDHFGRPVPDGSFTRADTGVFDVQLCLGKDTDGDGISDCYDNCPTVVNYDQVDQDCDGVGDACDDCQTIPDPNQPREGSTGDGGQGFACDPARDPDGDKMPNATDPWPMVANTAMFADSFTGTPPFTSAWSITGGTWNEDTTGHTLAQSLYVTPTLATASPTGVTADNVYAYAEIQRTQGPPGGSTVGLALRSSSNGFYDCEVAFGGTPGTLSVLSVDSTGQATVLAQTAVSAGFLDNHTYELRAFAVDQGGATNLACALHTPGTVGDGNVDDALAFATDTKTGRPASGAVELRTEQAAVQVSGFGVYSAPACAAGSAPAACVTLAAGTGFCAN